MSNLKLKMSNEVQNLNDKKKYDLAERTAKFAEDIIIFVKSLPDNTINHPLIVQILKSATSIAANYEEADGAESKKDFRHKLGVCKKEAKETRLWLRLIAKANPDKADECRKYWQESQELVRIFSSIIGKC